MKGNNVFSQAYDKLKNEGFIILLGSILLRLRMEFLLLPFALIAIKTKKYKDLDDLLDFCFHGIGRLIRPLQVREELRELLKIVGERKPEVVIEIGTYNGGTLFPISRVITENALIISIDFPDVRFGGGYAWWKSSLFMGFKLRRQNLCLIRADSHEIATLNRVKEVLKGRGVDFLFIDGDHSYEGVKKDFELYSPLLSSSGLLAFHDIVVHPPEVGCEVNKFWKEVITSTKYKHTEIINNPGQTSCGIGILVEKKQ